MPDPSEAGLLALDNFQRNQTLISLPECNRINRQMTDSEDRRIPSAGKSSVRLIKVPEDRAGQRLDNFLLGQLKGAPRSLVYKLVRSGQVRVNGGRAKAERKLEAGEEVRVPPVSLTEVGDKALPPAGFLQRMEQAIVFEDARLLVMAKTRSALTELQALLREDHDGSGPGGIRKRYLTLLVGRMPDGVMSVDAPLHVGLRQGGERHVQVNAAGKPSLSHFRVLERRGGHSYCEVRIETGRTHQIRVHARHIGHPVAGDDKYGDPAVNKRFREQIGLKRLFLHAASLEFALDGGKTPYVLNAPLAPELVEALDRLK